MKLADGREYVGELSAARQQAIQLGLLHGPSDGLVEIAAGARDAGGRLRLSTREDPGSFLPGGEGRRNRVWLERLLALVAAHERRGREVFCGVAVRWTPGGGKRHVAHTRWLWVDVDRPDRLPQLEAFLLERPAQLLVSSGGSGGMHAYWRLERPLDGAHLDRGGERLVEWIERANGRLVHALGVDVDGRPDVADPACVDRGRVLRLAGTVNGKTGRRASIVGADLNHPGWSLEELVGELPDPAGYRAKLSPSSARRFDHDDPYKRIAPPEYMRLLTGREPDAHGYVRCPAHEPDNHPSCRVWDEPERGWFCWSCRAGGDIFTLASLLCGGPASGSLTSEQFKDARRYLERALGAG